MTTTVISGPRVSSTSLPVRSVTVPAAAAGDPAAAATPPPAPAKPKRTYTRKPKPPAAAGTASRAPEPNAEVLQELGRLFWEAAMQGDRTPEAAVVVVLEKLRAARRLGELATLLGVE
jgi:hypothetical protein